MYPLIPPWLARAALVGSGEDDPLPPLLEQQRVEEEIKENEKRKRKKEKVVKTAHVSADRAM